MTIEELFARHEVVNEGILHAIRNLMRERRFFWQYASDNTDCKYTATFEGRNFQIHCNPQNLYFSVDGKGIDIDEEIIRILCNDIVKQKGMLRMEKRVEELENLNCWLNDKLAGNQ